jgi:hypothetical protein
MPTAPLAKPQATHAGPQAWSVRAFQIRGLMHRLTADIAADEPLAAVQFEGVVYTEEGARWGQPGQNT